MTNIWGFILQTVEVSLIALLILILKRLFKDKLSPRWQYGIWFLLFLALIKPTGYMNSYIIKNPMRMYETKIQRLDWIYDKLKSVSPITKCEKEYIKIDNIKEKLNIIIKNKVENTTTKYNNLIEKLELVNPLSTLKRGYSIVYKDNEVINNINKIKKDDVLNIRIYNGEIAVSVINIKEVE